MLNKSSPAIFTACVLLMGSGVTLASENGLRDPEMFRDIDNFENNVIRGQAMRKRSPYAYFADQAYSFGPDDLSYQSGSCCITCKGTASLFVDPVKNGIPVVSEDDY